VQFFAKHFSAQSGIVCAVLLNFPPMKPFDLSSVRLDEAYFDFPEHSGPTGAALRIVFA
jgi:hypothetical protein